jgi:hypothetical protein
MICEWRICGHTYEPDFSAIEVPIVSSTGQLYFVQL